MLVRLLQRTAKNSARLYCAPILNRRGVVCREILQLSLAAPLSSHTAGDEGRRMQSSTERSGSHDMVHPSTAEVEDEMLKRHKKELRQLEGKIRSLMKQAKQQSKKAEAEAKAAEMELEMKRRHAEELAVFAIGANATAGENTAAVADAATTTASEQVTDAATLAELADLEQALEEAKKKSEKKAARDARKKEIQESIRAASAPGAPVVVPEEFNSFFSEIYGDRWPQLLAALQKDDRQCARLNQHLGEDYVQSLTGSLLETVPSASVVSGSGFPVCVVPAQVEHDKVFPHPRSATKDGLLPYYIMDLASTVVPMGLPLRNGFQICDMCAAPGGKTLVLCERLSRFSDWSLTANERSNDRRNRLMQTIRDYVPFDLRSNVSVRGQDATTWRADEFSTYDAVLLDAPCSGERHLLHSAQHMADWTVRRTKRNGELQRSLLFTALKLLRPGGVVVYSTCSISPIENDEVVQRTIKRHTHSPIEILRREDLPELDRYIHTCMPSVEATESGYLILPDRCEGWGPMYFSILRKADDDD